MITLEVEPKPKTSLPLTKDGLLTIYGFDHGFDAAEKFPWVPINLVDNPVLQEIVSDTQDRMLNPAQDWQPEAVRTIKLIADSSIHIVFASEKPPTATSGIWFFGHTHTDIPGALKRDVGYDAVGSFTEESYVRIYPEQIGPLKRVSKIIDASLSVFFTEVDIFPAHLYRANRMNVREDVSRLEVCISLFDAETWADTQHGNRLLEAETLIAAEAKLEERLKILRGESPDSIAYMRDLRVQIPSNIYDLLH